MLKINQIFYIKNKFIKWIYIYFTGLILMLCVAIFTACTNHGISSANKERSDLNLKEKTLIVGMSPDYPPFEHKKSKKIQGFDVDLVRMLGRCMRRPIVIKEMEFGQILNQLTHNEIDFALSAISPNDHRLQYINFSDGYYATGLALVFKNNMISAKDTMINILEKKKIGVLSDTSTHHLLENYKQSTKKDLTTVSYNNADELMSALMTNKVGVALVEKQIALRVIYKSEYQNISMQSISDAGFDVYAIAFPKVSPIYDEVNKCILHLRNNGDIRNLKNKWLY